MLLGSWPVWLMPVLGMAAAVLLGWVNWRRRHTAAAPVRSWRLAAIWALQTLLAGILLLLLWHPALQVSTLQPQQNIVAVLVDDSRSMAIREQAGTRRDQVVSSLNSGLLDSLRSRFQTRLYRLTPALERMQEVDKLRAASLSTRLSQSLRELLTESSGLPLGAVILMSDGADNSGGIGLETIAELRSRRIPVHTVGFGRERPARDIEISQVRTPARALADSRLAAVVSFTQYGYSGARARLALREGGKLLASREITLNGDGQQQTETLVYNAGLAGAKRVDVSIHPLEGEENRDNNTVSCLVNVESAKPRVLYIEGEPRWEFKFLRRAIDEDRSVQLVSMLRTTQNKIYRQGIAEPKELEQGFPGTVEELFAYQGLILGSVEAGYFTATQLELIRQFIDRRGGGVLFLGGRSALSDGGWARSALADLLPVTLPQRNGTFHRDPATAVLTPAGAESLICRLEETPAANAARWQKLPALADYQEVGAPKPGAVVLADLLAPGNRRFPLLAIQNFGRGRVGVMATSGTWRWQMIPKLEDKTHEMFWQQMMRWLVADTPGHLVSSTPRPVLADESSVLLSAELRDRSYMPAADARVEARILGPDGLSEVVELQPDPATPGHYAALWNAPRTGSYLAEILARRGEQEAGRDMLVFQRQDGVAEHFRTSQNRELLEKLAAQTGGAYWKPSELSRLAEEISYSEAGITVRQTRDLWNMPAVFLLLVALKSAEWLLRRKWGVL